MRTRKIIRKYWTGTLTGSMWLLSYTGVPILEHWTDTVDFLVSVDQWIINNAAHPGLFIVFGAIFLGTTVAPAILGWVNHHWSIRKLWKMRDDGISLRNSCPDNEQYYREEWLPAFWKWRSELVDTANKISPHLSEWLGRLERVQGNVKGSANFTHVNNMSEILFRLGEYLKHKVMSE